MYTLNKILALQELFATNHLQINDFVFDQEYSYETKPSLKYPLLWADLESSDINEIKGSAVWEDNFVFNIACVDLVREDKSNEREVLSDCKLMLNDFLIHFRQTDFAEYLVVDPITTMSPIRMSGQDLTSGWGCKMKFKFITDPDLCGIPTT